MLRARSHSCPSFHLTLSGLYDIVHFAGVALSTCQLDHPDVHFDSLQEVIHLSKRAESSSRAVSPQQLPMSGLTSATAVQQLLCLGRQPAVIGNVA